MAFYPDGSFAMTHPPHPSMYFPRAQYPAYMHQPRHPEMMFQNFQFQEYPDFLPPGMMHEDYDDIGEVSTRPRLTKDQVEVLEAQFLSHPKPNSMVKKQLAMQTKLTLPRVANWFQNRRAKAKQQRKQEEYETQQNLGMNNGWKSDSRRSPSEASNKTASPGQHRMVPEMNNFTQELTEPRSPTILNDSVKEASWQSLQRALSAAKAAQRRRHPEVIQSTTIMPIDEQLPASSFNQFQTIQQPLQHPAMITPADWTAKADHVIPWVSSSTPDRSHAAFDFGFDQHTSMSTQQDLAVDDNNVQESQQFIVSPDDWQSSYSGETPQPQPQSDYGAIMSVSPPMPLPVFPVSRRGSGAEELTNNFGTFALQGTSPHTLGHLGEALPIRPTIEGEIDIASRRKRPRPAALTSVSLRSRSYGALSSTPPAFRSGAHNNGQLRHAKSAGHNLNSQYAGVRKSSMQSKSPLHIHSFAEIDPVKAEAFKNLMAQQAAAVSTASTPQTAHTITEHSMPATSRTMQPPNDIMPQYKQLQSPPVTPFQQDFMMKAAGMGMQPQVSGSSQYASLADYTPPYSAGPLTTSTCSWSDAPLQSPELSVFPSGTYMSSLGFNQEPPFQQWVLPTEAAAEIGVATTMADDRKTEFYITEFPGQKEEHHNVFQKISHQKPKNYVFANTAPSDYDL